MSRDRVAEAHLVERWLLIRKIVSSNPETGHRD